MQEPWRRARLGFFIPLNVWPMVEHLLQLLQALFKPTQLLMLPLALHFAWSLELLQRRPQRNAVPSACNLRRQEME
jgi:hypothetical protein